MWSPAEYVLCLCLQAEDGLKHKVRNRPDRADVVNMHILQGESAPRSIPTAQMKLKRARLADDLNEKIALRPGPLELVEKNILPVDSAVKEASLCALGSEGSQGSDRLRALGAGPLGVLGVGPLTAQESWWWGVAVPESPSPEVLGVRATLFILSPVCLGLQ
uniref:Phosphatase and actin regulator n=1 Tax=Canis lupus familiaris TaxID=9615 RepID=A0A8C0MQI0_CANLF